MMPTLGCSHAIPSSDSAYSRPAAPVSQVSPGGHWGSIVQFRPAVKYARQGFPMRLPVWSATIAE